MGPRRLESMRRHASAAVAATVDDREAEGADRQVSPREVRREFRAHRPRARTTGIGAGGSRGGKSRGGCVSAAGAGARSPSAASSRLRARGVGCGQKKEAQAIAAGVSASRCHAPPARCHAPPARCLQTLWWHRSARCERERYRGSPLRARPLRSGSPRAPGVLVPEVRGDDAGTNARAADPARHGRCELPRPHLGCEVLRPPAALPAGRDLRALGARYRSQPTRRMARGDRVASASSDRADRATRDGGPRDPR